MSTLAKCFHYERSRVSTVSRKLIIELPLGSFHKTYLSAERLFTRSLALEGKKPARYWFCSAEQSRVWNNKHSRRRRVNYRLDRWVKWQLLSGKMTWIVYWWLECSLRMTQSRQFMALSFRRETSDLNQFLNLHSLLRRRAVCWRSRKDKICVVPGLNLLGIRATDEISLRVTRQEKGSRHSSARKRRKSLDLETKLLARQKGFRP